MADRRLIVSELRKLGDAVGYKLSEERFKQYISDLEYLTDSSFIAACNNLRVSWERANFPPVGAIINKAKALGGDGRPNAIQQNRSSKTNLSDPRIAESLRRHEEYLKMTHDEYMQVVLATRRSLDGH